MSIKEIQKSFLAAFNGAKIDEPLKNHCTFAIGGPADLFINLENNDELVAVLKFAKENNLKYFLFGSGSNLLFADEGFRGLVIKMADRRFEIDENYILTAKSGAIVAEILAKTVQLKVGGFEKWVGLPGTIGGAVRGNAGCNGLETKDFLIEANVLDPETLEIKTWKNKEFDFEYRESVLKTNNLIVLEAKFQLSELTISSEEQKQFIAKTRKRRIELQPFGATSGSFFKNPAPDKAAGMLIDQAGLKGYRIGQAQISEKHGNFFMNLGGAKAAEIKQLAAHAQKIIKEKFGYQLVPEVQFVEHLL
jgi:UDP-N-acetylmuramate dehydrogenase